MSISDVNLELLHTLEKYFTSTTEMKRQKPCREVRVGKVSIGGNNPVVVQAMTSGTRSDQKDYRAVARDELKEVLELARAGSELVRVALNNESIAKAIPYIVEGIVRAGFDEKLIVGCGQYEVADLIEKYPTELKLLGKLRINPGNIGFGEKRDHKFEKVIKFARDNDIPVRIGVNWGSLDKYIAQALMDRNNNSTHPQSSTFVLRTALVLSVLNNVRVAEDLGLRKIILSCKVSKVQDLIAIYRALALYSDYPLHLGITEAGSGIKGITTIACGIGLLLQEGIGDTIRASLTPRPGEPRSNEVRVCQEILQALNLRNFAPQITSCPGCGRTSGEYFQEMAVQVDEYVQSRMPIWKKDYPGVENMNIAVMGCIVNGPGESKHADLGISLPGYGEKPVAAVFANGQVFCTLRGNDIITQFKQIIEKYVEKHYSKAV